MASGRDKKKRASAKGAGLTLKQARRFAERMRRDAERKAAAKP